MSVVAGALLFGIAGCSSGDDEVIEQPEADVTSVHCQYNFEATVKAGPSTGLSLVGHLWLIETEPGHAEGGLIIPATATEAEQQLVALADIDASNKIDLTFELPGGKKVSGSGDLGKPFAECAAPVTGTEAGPEADDTGDWAVTSFFGGGTTTTCTTPLVKNPSYSGGNVFMTAGGSCIASNATMRLRNPGSTTALGTYTLGFDMSGTLIRSSLIGAATFPAGTCKVVDVTNPTEPPKTSAAVTVCR